jgi:hypothetical protein
MFSSTTIGKSSQEHEKPSLAHQGRGTLAMTTHGELYFYLLHHVTEEITKKKIEKLVISSSQCFYLSRHANADSSAHTSSPLMVLRGQGTTKWPKNRELRQNRTVTTSTHKPPNVFIVNEKTLRELQSHFSHSTNGF